MVGTDHREEGIIEKFQQWNIIKDEIHINDLLRPFWLVPTIGGGNNRKTEI
jgi:hypothetical protein